MLSPRKRQRIRLKASRLLKQRLRLNSAFVSYGVDNQYLIRETAPLILKNPGYEVLTAADGLDALHALSKSLPDLIISDLNMPLDVRI